MAEIQEYLPQTDTAQPMGGVSPNIELSTELGRAMQNVGGAIEQGVTRVRQRAVQEETADVYSQHAEMRADQSVKLQQQIQDGSLDVDKFMDEYDQQSSDMKEGLETPEGTNYFNRQNNRLRGQLLKTANAGMAQIAMRSTQAALKSSMNKQGAVLEENPDQFEDIHDAGREFIDQMVQTGGLPEKMKDQAYNEMTSQFAESAVRGFAKKYGKPMAEKMMLAENLGGYLSADQRNKMDREINQIAQAKEIDSNRAFEAHQHALTLNEQAWATKNMAGIVNGSVSAEDVLDKVSKGQLREPFAREQIDLISKYQAKPFKTDPSLFNDLAQRIVNPTSNHPIDSPEEIGAYVGKGDGHGISLDDYERLSKSLRNTPENKEIAQQEHSLFQALSTVRFKNPINDQYDVLGEQRLMEAKKAYFDEKARSSPEQRRALLDPNSSTFFLKKISAYQTTPEEAMQHQAERRTTKSLEKTPNDLARKPNETIEQWKKRTQ